MKFLRKQLDMVEPLFKKGGKLEKLYPLYEANDTFLFTPGEVTKGTSHVRDAIDMKRMMSTVIVALVPCIFMALWNTGYQANLAIAEQGASPLQHSITGLGFITRDAIFTEWLGLEYDPNSFIANVVHGALWFLPVYAACMAVGGLCEVTFAIIRGHEINEGFLVSGMLFPLTLPPAIPLWQVGLGIAFGIVVGKEIFGGTGKNFLNPALTARAFLYFAHASFMSGDSVWTAAGANEKGIDGWTAATTLGSMAKADINAAANVTAVSGLSWVDCFMGWIPGSMGETSALAALIGAVVLIGSGIGSWRIMAGVVVGSIGMSCMLYAFREYSDNPMFYVSPLRHLIIGGFAFGTVFMATDPVSASMTETGKWWYGGLIGVLTVLIRVINPAFAEGIMLAILFGNVMAPLIDYFVIEANVKRRAARYATT